MADIFEIQERARAALVENGIRPSEWVEPEKLCYFPTEDGSDKTAGRCRLHIDNPPTLWLCNHYRHDEKGITVSLRGEGESFRMSDEEYQAFLDQVEQNRKQRDAEKTAKQDAVAAAVRKELKTLPPAGDDNPYLARKGVHAVKGLRQDAHGNLVIPAYDGDGKIVNVQRVPGAAGQKKLWTTGGKAADVFFPVCSRKDGPLYIGEGIATMLSVYEATGAACLSVFQAGNLLGVAKLAREKFPKRDIIIAGDEDTTKKDADGNIVKRMPSENAGRIKAMKAAEAIGARCVICPEVDERSTDFDDLRRARGKDAVRKALEAAAVVKEQAEAEPWLDVAEFSENELPRLDVEKCLPAVMAEYVNAIAEQMEVPVELPFSMALGSFAVATQRKCYVRIKDGYREPLCVYIVCALDPAHRKSPVVSRCTSRLQQWERDERTRLAKEAKTAISWNKTLQKQIEALRAKAGACRNTEELDELQKRILEAEGRLVEVPHPTRLLVDDITPEQMAVVAADNDELIAIVTSEAGVFDTLAGRYNNGMANIDFVLQAHDGLPVIVDRGKRDPINMEHPRMTMALSTQRITLTTCVSSKVFRGRGLNGRFLYVLPPSNLGKRTFDEPYIAPERFAGFEDSMMGVLNGISEETTLTLSDGAKAAWKEFALAIEHLLPDGAEFQYMRDWAGKLAGRTARVAGIYHMMEHPASQPISEATMRKAVNTGWFFADHAKAAYDLMGTSDRDEGAKAILKWIEKDKPATFSGNECLNRVRGNNLLDTMDKLNPCLKALEERNFIRKREAEYKGKGRRPGAVYEVNPKLLNGAG